MSDGAVTPLRKAASLVLLHPSPDSESLRTLLLLRKSKMSFQQSYVFPGGACDPGDIAQVGSSQFVQYGKITALRECLEETGLLVYPRDAEDKVKEVIKRGHSLSGQLGEIWMAHLGLIEPVLRFMTPQREKNKRFDSIISDKVRVLNFEMLKLNNSYKDILQPIFTDLNQTKLCIDKKQSESFLHDAPLRILDQLFAGKLTLFPPQIIILSILINLQQKRSDILNHFCQNQKQNYYKIIQPIMFEIERNRFCLFGDSTYSYKSLLQKQPKSESRDQIERYFNQKVDQDYLKPSNQRYMTFAKRQICFQSNCSEKGSFLEHIQNNLIEKSVLKPKL